MITPANCRDNPVVVACESGIVPSDILRNFDVLVKKLGGNGSSLLASASLNAAFPNKTKAGISFRAATTLLRNSASRLNCPEFGMRLADSQRNLTTPNLFEVVMRNSATIKDALAFSADKGYAYSGLISVSLKDVRSCDFAAVEFDFLSEENPGVRQLAEYMLLRTCNISHEISGKVMSPRAIYFKHAAVAPEEVYQRYFGAPVCFQQTTNAIHFDRDHLQIRISSADHQTCELATYFINKEFIQFSSSITGRVRGLVEQHIQSENCTAAHISCALGLHARTLQRRLREEGTSFDNIKDEVRRNITLARLRDSDLPLVSLAQIIGYAEVSALTRSCYRWFSASPRQLRKKMAVKSASAISYDLSATPAVPGLVGSEGDALHASDKSERPHA